MNADLIEPLILDVLRAMAKKLIEVGNRITLLEADRAAHRGDSSVISSELTQLVASLQEQK